MLYSLLYCFGRLHFLLSFTSHVSIFCIITLTQHYTPTRKPAHRVAALVSSLTLRHTVDQLLLSSPVYTLNLLLIYAGHTHIVILLLVALVGTREADRSPLFSSRGTRSQSYIRHRCSVKRGSMRDETKHKERLKEREAILWKQKWSKWEKGLMGGHLRDKKKNSVIDGKKEMEFVGRHVMKRWNISPIISEVVPVSETPLRPWCRGSSRGHVFQLHLAAVSIS